MSFNPRKGVGVFTDGSCFWMNRIGSWAWVAFDVEGNEIHDADAVQDTTSNRMEMTAAIRALQKLADWGPLNVMIWSDSEYLVLGNKNPTRSRKANKDLWEQLDLQTKFHNITWEHVKGHEDSHYNDFVDRLAGEVRKDACK